MSIKAKLKDVVNGFISKNEFLKNKVLPHYMFYKTKYYLLNKIIPNLKKQFILLGSNNYDSVNVQNKVRIFIPYIETSHYYMYLMLIVAKALQMRGAEIKFLYCNGTMPTCERQCMHMRGVNICKDCRLHQKYLLPLFGLEMCELKEIISAEKCKAIYKQAREVCENYPVVFIYNGIDLIPAVNDSVLRYYYGGQASSDKELSELRANHLATAIINAEVAKRIERDYRPGIILTTMSVYSAWQPYYDYFRKQSSKVVSLGMTQFNYNAITINWLENFLSLERYKDFLGQRQNRPLDPQEKDELARVLKQREFDPGLSYKERKGVFNNDMDADNIKKFLKIDPSKRNIFMFTNLLWDVGLSQVSGLYDNMIAWVLSTIEIMAGNPDINLYIKPHPMEKYHSTESTKGIIDYIHDRFSVLPENIFIVPPEKKINTYKLFPYVDLGILNYGTLGLELMLNDIPVVITGKAFYKGLSLCYEPATKDEYHDILLGEINRKQSVNRDLLELFSYFYFIKSGIPFEIMRPIFNNTKFEKYNISSLDGLLPGRNYYLDHVCDCILRSKQPESWQRNANIK